MIEASIVIPTYNKLSRLKLVLKSLEQQMTPQFEVIVVFDGCHENVLEAYDQLTFLYEPKKVICKQNIGRAAARNRGIEVANGKIIIFLDDDRIPAKDFIKKHLEAHKKKCVVLGERMEIQLEEMTIESLYNQSNDFEQVFQRGQLERGKRLKIRSWGIYRWTKFYTGNVSVEKEDIERVNGFDEHFTAWGNEDIDLGIRLQKLRLPFLKEAAAINYHIVHESNYKDKSAESITSLKYMLKKYKKYKVVCYRLLMMVLRQKVVGLPIVKFTEKSE